ncbi:MAG TPA: hypothetical protein VK698_00520 [Kofleriaceae bacterium]|nr:hypothetical protein [Kofleriaceae bacterium]
MRFGSRIALAAMLTVGACSDDEEASRLDDIDFITYNSLAPAAFLDNGDALNALGGGALDGATTALVDSEPGRALLSYVVRCALGSGATATFPRPGAPALVYTGLLGFAPAWKQGSLNLTGRRLMTGCLMAHVNAFETQVPISIRNAVVGDAGLVEKLLYSAQELAVYGNYFAPAAEREVYVCFGQAVAQSLGNDGALSSALPSYLDLRVCSTSQQCGFNRVGACYHWPSTPQVTTWACERQSGSLFESCHEAPIQQQVTPAWEETVSVYLQPVHLTLLLTTYVDLICEISGGLICDLIGL